MWDREIEIKNIEDPRPKEASRTDEEQLGDTRREGGEVTDTTIVMVSD